LACSCGCSTGPFDWVNGTWSTGGYWRHRDNAAVPGPIFWGAILMVVMGADLSAL